ncbi:MAG: hypothetical protein WBC44_17425 [Planctomycetaceae bacterium]
MDACSLRLSLTLVVWLVAAPFASAAQFKTPNFVVHAPTEDFAKKVAFTAERWRSRLAKEWLGHELPNWYKPCPIEVQVGQIGAGGATTFNFDRNRRTGEQEVFGWRMNVQGTAERILDSVIPHEVSHTIFASHFRRPLPRWADEGAATLAEHESEQRRQDLHLKQVWNTSHKIPLQSLLSMTEYPSDMRDVLTLYAQGYSLADFLVQKRGKATYLKFLASADKDGWKAALLKHYEIEDIESLEGKWGNWVLAGSPDLPKDTLLADATENGATENDDGTVVRAQNEDGIAAAWAAASTRSAAPPRPNSERESSEPQRTAALDGDYGIFLPPQTRVAAASAGSATADGKEPRPAPLGGHVERETSMPGDGGATETSGSISEGDDRSLPRTSRVEPSASNRRGFDFFGVASDERTNGGNRVLGMSDFPGRR